MGIVYISVTANLSSEELDFLGSIRLVNYIRAEVKRGNTTPDTSSKQLFAADDYLQSVLEDDALLFSLGDFDEIQPSNIDFSDSTSNPDVSSTRTFNSVEMAHILESLKHQYDRVNVKLTNFTGRMKEGITKTYETHGVIPGRRWSTMNLPLAGEVSLIRNGDPSRQPNHETANHSLNPTMHINYLNPNIPTESPGGPNMPSRGAAADDHYFESYAQIGMYYALLTRRPPC